MTKFNVSRSFDHRTFGRVGIVELVAEVATVTIDGKVLPDTSVEYLLTFALQNLQDAYAGAESADEAQARWAKKLDRLVEGTIGTRESGDGATVEVKMIRTVLREQVRKSAKWEAFKALADGEQNDKLDGLYAKQGDDAKARIDADVKARLAALAARKTQAKALADMVELDF